MLIRFTDITEHLKYPPAVKGRLSSYHSSIILYSAQNFMSTRKFRRQVINTLNTITYLVIHDEELPASWSESSPLLSDAQLVDEFDCKDSLGSLFLAESDIEWDVEEIEASTTATNEPPNKVTAVPEEPLQPVEVTRPNIPTQLHHSPDTAKITNIEDLSIQPPMYPQVDFSRPWFSATDMGVTYAIYPSLPQIPTTQREISITTDVSCIPEYALLDLFPSHVMQTRGAEMYDRVAGLDWDDVLGVILPIKGFTPKQVKDNIVKYPHLYKITRLVDGKQVSFHKMIEVDGELRSTTDVWDELPDTKHIPKTTAFVKEYVIRRYLLERDIRGVDHSSKIFGDLSPFLTLFLPASDYSKFGYKDPLHLAKCCVQSRVAYKQSRNPVLRRFADE